MSSDPPQSGAPYIIICSGRISVKIADDNGKRAKAASDCASQLVTYLGLRFKDELKPEHTREISRIQHWLMDHMWDKPDPVIDGKITELFEKLDALEDQFESY